MINKQPYKNIWYYETPYLIYNTHISMRYGEIGIRIKGNCNLISLILILSIFCGLTPQADQSVQEAWR
jgi:hypothetical protein